MKVSLNTVKEYIDFELPPIDELKERINEQLGKVEQVVDLAAKYSGIVIVKVVRTAKHPNADKLTVCLVDDGGVMQNVPRDENGYVQVVCGAPNVHADMFAVWLPPNTTVPASFDTAEPFVLSARELRGVVSQGMLAAADELAIGSDHAGIIELTENDLPPHIEKKSLAPGQDFAELFGLDDVIFDIENKMFTHRPDLFGQLGVAREISAILGGLPDGDSADADTRFVNPDWYWSKPAFDDATGLELTVFNEAPDKVPRFMAVAMDNVTVKPSPLWLQTTLVRWGSKAINNVVDATNYIMLLTAQPTHAYDYDKIRGHTIGARMAENGETAKLLNGKTYELTSDDIVIADGEGVVGVAGIMGGAGSEVDAATKRIILEVGTFDMYTVRKTSMRYGLFTDALTRFNKGQSPLQNDHVMAELMAQMQSLCGGVQASPVADRADESVLLDEASLSGEIAVSADFVNARLGSTLTTEQIGGLLRRANFASYPAKDDQTTLLITAPFWRTDIEQAEDIVEEVGRLYGFDKLPRVLPQRSLKPAPKNQKLVVKQLIRDSLARAGANEVLTYSFVHKNLMERAGQDITQAFQLSNALSPDLQYYRLSLTPSLLDKVHPNIKAGHDEFSLFEIGKGHNKQYHADDDDGLPSEMEFVDVVYTSKKPKDGAPYYYVRRLVTQLGSDLGFDLVFSTITDAMDYPLTAPFDLSRSALVTTDTGEFIGMIGELKQSVIKNFKLPEYTAAMTLDLVGVVVAYQVSGVRYMPLSRFPSTVQDISLKVATNVEYKTLRGTVDAALAAAVGDTCQAEVTPLTIYQGEEDTAKTTTFRIILTSYDKTLTDTEASAYVDAVAVAAASQCGAVRV